MLSLWHTNGGSLYSQCVTAASELYWISPTGAILQSIRIWFPPWKHHSVPILCLHVCNVPSLPACPKRSSIPSSIHPIVPSSLHAAGQAAPPIASQKPWSNVYIGTPAALWLRKGDLQSGLDRCRAFKASTNTNSFTLVGVKCTVALKEKHFSWSGFFPSNTGTLALKLPAAEF